jgi:hypothetical protein
MSFCTECGISFPPQREALGYSTCLECGEHAAKQARMGWTVAPMHKSNYVLVTNPDLLKQFNPKRTQS